MTLYSGGLPLTALFSRQPMPKITYIDPTGPRNVEAEIGSTVMETAIKNGDPRHRGRMRRRLRLRDLPRLCRRGLGEKTGEPSPMEEDMLDFGFDVRPNSRLSCQIKVTRRARRPGGPHARDGRRDQTAASLERMTEPIKTDVAHHRRGPVRAVRGVRARPARHEGASGRHPRQARRPMRRALSGKADLRHSGHSLRHRRRAWSRR